MGISCFYCPLLEPSLSNIGFYAVIMPAGRFDRTRDPQTGRTLVVPGSYRSAPANPVGPWGMLLSIARRLVEASEVIIEASEVIIFVLLADCAPSPAAFRSTLGVIPQPRTRPEAIAMFLLISEGSCCILPSVTEKSYEQAARSCPWHA